MTVIGRLSLRLLILGTKDKEFGTDLCIYTLCFSNIVAQMEKLYIFVYSGFCVYS